MPTPVEIIASVNTSFTNNKPLVQDATVNRILTVGAYDRATKTKTEDTYETPFSVMVLFDRINLQQAPSEVSEDINSYRFVWIASNGNTIYKGDKLVLSNKVYEVEKVTENSVGADALYEAYLKLVT